ncbi:MAG: hypothetical protein ACJ74T_15670 [Pyrinomonadaceae bacterium]
MMKRLVLAITLASLAALPHVGAAPPEPSPSVDPAEVEFIKPPSKRRVGRR